MEARVLRRIRSGAEFDHLFPKCTGEDRSLKKDAGVEDTLRLIIRTVPETSWHTAKIAQVLKGDSLNETCSNIWHFVYEHIQYNKDDDGYEQIRSPRRTWRDRQVGGDCDDYTEFIASVLTNLRIPFKPRIAIYDYSRGYQHIYIVVPKDGRLNYDLTDRRDYTVIDCVKDAYDDEHPFLETKDYDMKLQYLDGIEPRRYAGVDSQDFSDGWDGEEFGGLKDLVQKVGSTVKKVADTVIDKAGDALREVNRYANPATILLRNGFLAAMNINLFNVADKIRFAYWTEDQARKANMNIDAWKKLVAIKNKAETIYYDAGGEKAALRKAILEGKGNRDKKVPLSGFGGFTGYGDPMERQILQSSVQGLSGGLGEVVTAAMITAATGAITALGLTIKQVGSLFQKGTPEGNTYDSTANAVVLPAESGNSSSSYSSPLDNAFNTAQNNNAFVQTNTTTPNQTPYPASPAGGDGMVSNSYTGNSPGGQATYTDNSGSTAMVRVDAPTQTEEKGVFGLVKKYPSYFLFGSLALGTGFFLYKTHQHEKKEALSGIPSSPRPRKKAPKKRKGKTTSKKHSKKIKISAIKL